MTTTCCPEGAALTRRTLLKAAGAAAVAAGLVPTVGARVSYAAGYTGDVVVVLSLRGGMDGLSLVAPVGDPDYARLRPTIGVPASLGVPTGDRTFALHPSLAPLKPFWDAGLFGAVHAVGSPDSSRSHFQATEELERAAPGSTLRTGWMDRVLGLRGSGTVFQSVQLGSGVAAPLLLGPNPDLSMRTMQHFVLEGADWVGPRLRTALTALHVNGTGPAVPAARTTLAALSATADVYAGAPAPQNGARYPAGELGTALQDTVRMIRGAAGLQSVCLDVQDWDMHANLGTVDKGWMHDKATELAQGLAAFATDLGPALDKVCLVTMSEFGRRAGQNGSGGVDHGYGNAVLLLGGGIVGGRVHGRWPGLSPAALDHGDLAGTVDYRTVLSELLLKRTGMSVASLAQVFPGFTPAPLGIAR